MDKPHPLLKADAIRDMPEYVRQHQFNENAIRHTRSIGDHLGLRNIGIHLVRLEPGRESTQFHFHHQDEEFLYILSGRAIAEIGDEEYEVGPGDFMAFTAHSLPHSLRNPFDDDLVYLMGGDRSPIDICDYPRIKRRMYRENGVKQYLDLEHLHDVDPKVR
ncbi:MAG: cupin domain-containing protein [Pseudomonadales bacterium]|nr:cupin domain-containing protein [Pseudomonadales bacterium]